MLSEHNPQAWSALLQFIAEQAADILNAEMESHPQASIESHQQRKLKNESIESSHLRPIQHR